MRFLIFVVCGVLAFFTLFQQASARHLGIECLKRCSGRLLFGRCFNNCMREDDTTTATTRRTRRTTTTTTVATTTHQPDSSEEKEQAHAHWLDDIRCQRRCIRMGRVFHFHKCYSQCMQEKQSTKQNTPTSTMMTTTSANEEDTDGSGEGPN